jgi:hypothetical protein
MNWLAEGARGLSPAYFALVMATGIVSIASDIAGLFPDRREQAKHLAVMLDAFAEPKASATSLPP